MSLTLYVKISIKAKIKTWNNVHLRCYNILYLDFEQLFTHRIKTLNMYFRDLLELLFILHLSMNLLIS